ncbi:hypothetical protein EDB19DRAFT_1917896 [Suillus lakei]|nr:hypothetical protein EDB19DRAFT_1917896 [Suillus lakei]
MFKTQNKPDMPVVVPSYFFALAVPLVVLWDLPPVPHPRPKIAGFDVYPGSQDICRPSKKRVWSEDGVSPLIEYAGGLNLFERASAYPMWKQLTDQACDIIAWSEHAVSCAKGMTRGSWLNIVAVLMKDRNCSFGSALACVGTLVRTRSWLLNASSPRAWIQP